MRVSIALEHLTKRYAGQPVVHEVSLEVAAGELFVLLGPSGSGKSTLLRMIAGLAEVDAGRILLHGRDVTSLSPQAPRIRARSQMAEGSCGRGQILMLSFC